MEPMEKKKFKDLFPHLTDELENGKNVADLESETARPKKAFNANRRWEGYDPDIIDFIRRCKIPEQAVKIIDYMSNEGEISSEMTEKLKKQLEEEGLRSFGTLKEKGHYHRNAR
jgi:hypothetical protein